MRKSELYRAAQLSVLRDGLLDAPTKLEALRLLMGDEDMAVYVERATDEKKKKE